MELASGPTQTECLRTDPKIISLDIETYGACKYSYNNLPLPNQTVFNPLRSLHTDKVDLDNLILTVAVTLPEYDPRTPDSPELDTNLISELSPGETMVFQMSKADHRGALHQWLTHSDTILGMNLLFDIQYLRQIKDFRYVLDGKHTLIDLSVINYLHSELRPEKSLKSLGPILGTHSYRETLKDNKFESPLDKNLISYNAQDTHNTLACIAELASRINDECNKNHQSLKMPSIASTSSSSLKIGKGESSEKTSSKVFGTHSKPATTGAKGSNETIMSSVMSHQVRSTSPSSILPSSHSSSQVCKTRCHQGSDKLQPTSVAHYSNTIWSCIRMTESGIPMSLSKLHELLDLLTLKCNIAARVATSRFNLVLEGTGSAKSKQEFLNSLISEVESSSCPGILSHPLLSLTPKTKKISWSEDNRNLLSSYLPKDHPLQEAVRIVKYHAAAQKLISTYLFPLLFHRRNRPQDKSSILIPFSPQIGLAHPQWYIVPSLPKDTGSEGGTIQGRITCKSPSAQTFPPLIKKAMKSRWKKGTILGFDLSQIELRVAALLSGDEKLLQSFNEGLDLHTDRTLSVFGEEIKDELDFKSKWRQIGKTLNFADLFLASASRMQRTVVEMCGDLLPLEFFENIVKTRYEQRPGLTKWQYHLCCAAERDGSITLPYTGQSRTFTNFQVDHNKWARSRIPSTQYNSQIKSQINEVVNFPIQTTAGNVLLHIQHELSRIGPNLNAVGPRPLMFLQVYDSVYFDCPTDQIDLLTDTIEQAVSYVDSPRGYWGYLQQEFSRSVPLLYEVDLLT